MSDKIEQVLGFDASRAIDTLKQLDGALAQLQSGLNSSAGSFSVFNKGAGKTVSALVQITKNAKLAHDALAKIGGVQGIAGGQSAVTAAANMTDGSKEFLASLKATGSAADAAAITVTNATRRMANGVATNANSIVNSSTRMTTSLALLSRIVFTQFIVRALSQLRNAFRQTAGDAIEFQKQLALISTIDGSGQSLGSLSDTVRSISDNFNIPLLQTAAGLYQTISNQVGNTAESTEFLGEAAKFAKATNSSLENSVDLLSGALKSYNLGVEDTDRVSSIFFKTIDLGRITADRLANAFGRVGPAAADLGVEMEEVAAAIAAISVRGSNTAESLTQFRNILTALVKPSDAMSVALNSIGFESAEAAIKTLGVVGTLRELVKGTNGSAEALARLFANVRGLNGVASLTSDDLLTLTTNIDEMTAAGEKFTDSKFLQATATDAEKVTDQINKLKNAFTVDLGQAFLKAIADAADYTGGVENVTGAAKSAGPAIAGLAFSVGALGVAFKIAALAGVGMSTAFAGLLAVPLALGAGKSLGEFIDTKIFEKNFKEINDLRVKNIADLKRFSEELEAASDLANKADKDRAKTVRETSRDISASYLAQRNIAMSANTSLVKNTKSSINEIVEAFQKLNEAEASAAANARTIQSQSAERLGGLQDRLSDINFDTQTQGFTEAQKVFALNQKSAELASQAASTLANAGGDQDKINRGLALFSQSQRAAEQAGSLAERTDNTRLQQSAQKQLESSINAQVGAEKRLQNAQEGRIAGLSKERAVHQDLLDAIREQAKLAADNTGIFDGQNKKFSAEDQEKRDKTRVAALAKMQELTSQVDTGKLRELGLEDFVNKFEAQLTSDPIRLAFSVEEGTKRIQDQLTASFQDFTVHFKLETGLNVADIAAAAGKQLSELDSPEKVFATNDENNTKAAEARKQLDSIRLTGQELVTLNNEITATLAKIESFRGGRASVHGEIGESANAAFNGTVSLLTELSQKSKLTSDDMDVAGKAIKSFNDLTRSGDAQLRIGFNSSSDALDVMLLTLLKVQDAQNRQGQLPAADKLQSDLQKLDAVQQSIQSSDVSGRLQQSGQALSTGAAALVSTETSSALMATQAQAAGEALKSGAAAWLQASQAQFQTPRVPAALQTNGLAKGGFARYFANGGFMPRGMDTRPAMLRDGESVLNPDSSRRFFSQIQAMNAGQNPIYRSDGGHVTNVGDISINVNGSGSPAKTARTVVQEIRRETRRGTSRL